MKNKVISVIVCCLAFCMAFCGLNAECAYDTVGEVQDLADGIIAYKTGGQSVQEWINGELTENAGAYSEWYVITLSQSGDYDFSSYESALLGYLDSNNISSATSRQKYALALSAVGSTNGYIEETMDNSIGQQGIMSLIYGLHLLNNNYTSSRYSTGEVIEQILSMQLSDGGWAVIGEYGDVDVTAMALHALASQQGYSGVEDAVNRGLEFLSAKQLDSGGFKTMGTENPESASQVIVALSAVGIDCLSDGRFIKNGNTIFSAMAKYRNDDGSFSHVEGDSSNDTATVQAYYAFVSYLRMTKGQGAFLMLDHRSEISHETQEPNETEFQDIPSDEPSQSEIYDENNSNDNNDVLQSVETQEQSVLQEIVTTTVISSNLMRVSSETTTASTEITANTGTSTLTETASTASANTYTVSSVQYTASAYTETSHTVITSAAAAVFTDNKQDGTASDKNSKSGYKKTAIIVIVSAGSAVCLIMFLMKKRNPKSYIAVLISAGVLIAVVMLTDISSADDYYSDTVSEKTDITGTVTMTIRCDTVAGRAEYIPDDGIILDVTEFSIEEGDTVFDVLNDAARTYGIQVENTGSAGNAHGMVYIAGINYIYEFDYGDLSGWMYLVNGEEPSVGCGNYTVEDGDIIEWLYTCEIGNDLNIENRRTDWD